MEGSKGGKTASTPFPALDDVFNRAGLGKELVAADVPDDAVIMKEEIFGPVGCFASFSCTKDVIKRANDSPFGLAAAIWSSDLSTCLTVADGLEAGTVWINGMMGSWGYGTLS